MQARQGERVGLFGSVDLSEITTEQYNSPLIPPAMLLGPQAPAAPAAQEEMAPQVLSEAAERALLVA